VKSGTFVQIGKETSGGDSVESILEVQAQEAAIRKRLKANMGGVYHSFNTDRCENIALDIPQVRIGRVRYPGDGVAMSPPR
jgi:hypothetical protein